MSCKDCDDLQENTDYTAYYRWKNANVEMRGCSKHLREIFDALNSIQFPDKDMDEAIERYNKAKENGTLDRDFPRIV